MGEARRRKLAGTYPKPIGALVPFRNIATGNIETARAAGDPMVWREQLLASAETVLRGNPVPTATVPCAGCTECCYHSGVDVHPTMEPPERLAHLDLEWREDSQGWFLRKRADGACVHLGPGGCTVYEYRPNACRQYDCRLYALFGVLDSYDGDHRQPTWMFQPQTAKGRAFMAACGALSQMETIRRQRSGESWSASDIANHVMTHPDFQKIADALLVLAKADPETRNRLLGFDPEQITLEQISENYQQMIATPIQRSREPINPPDKL
ncbi:MAG TPA: YkgJ family cysteine cluster protein [Candidatus Angelobacter sp.]|jgi:hypothetical protein|nr:YkgJ family cysteine cluster protein [Candidatus Angelobacter sp.]